MFEDTGKKIKICAYIYFFGNLFQQCYRDIVSFTQLGSPQDLILTSLFNLLYIAILDFVVALIIYGIGKIIEYYEVKMKNISFSNNEK